MKKLKPKLNPHLGCWNCGGGEMKGDGKVILCDLATRLYQGMGGWCIQQDGELFFAATVDLPYKDNPTLAKFEKIARKHPKSDWRAVFDSPLRSAEYQRQGKDRWVLVKTGPGFA